MQMHHVVFNAVKLSAPEVRLLSGDDLPTVDEISAPSKDSAAFSVVLTDVVECPFSLFGSRWIGFGGGFYG